MHPPVNIITTQLYTAVHFIKNRENIIQLVEKGITHIPKMKAGAVWMNLESFIDLSLSDVPDEGYHIINLSMMCDISETKNARASRW